VGGALQLLVADQLLRVLLQAINPAVAHAVTELLLLAPQHILGQVRLLWRVKRLPQDVLLDAACGRARRRAS